MHSIFSKKRFEEVLMEEIIQETLNKGVELHIAGQFDLASQLYSSVIKLQPNHADANHNMGLLKLDMGHDLEALPYLQTALQSDTSIAQFWLSYSKALINLERLDEAGRILDLAKENGFEGEEFVELTQLINTETESAKVSERDVDIASQSKPNILDSMKLDQALRLAEKKAKDGKTKEALRIYQDILAKLPTNKRAQKGLANLNKPKQPTVTQEPPQEQINQLVILCNQGQLAAAVEKANILIAQYPDAFIIWNILGAAKKGLGLIQAASEAFKKVTDLNPTYADGFSNLGVTLQELGKLDEAIASCKKALSLKPDYAEAHYNMGNALQEQGELDEAIASYNKSLSLKPDHAEAKHNLAETLKIYSPKYNHGNLIIDLDNKIKAKHNAHALPKIDQELAAYTSNLLNELQHADKNLSTENSQIYRRNNVDLNCKRHMQIFEEKKIIPKFCFGCYKVQVDVTTVLDLIRLVALFYESEFESDLTRKCIVEVRPNISGSYKGLIYCRGIDQAHSVKTQLDVQIRDIDKNLVAKIKKGCSEFPLAFPEYGEVAVSEEEMWQYPQAWQTLEVEFDTENPIPPNTNVYSSLKEFCLSDYLIIQKWIDYAKGIGDPTSELFCDLPVKYHEIMEIAKARVKQ